MIVLGCRYCGSKEISPKSLEFKSKLGDRFPHVYCSDDCYYMDYVPRNIFATVFSFIFLTPLIPFWFFALRHAIKGIKMKKTDYGQRKKLKFCFYCQKEIAEIPEGKGVCMSCGELIHFCDLCQDHIFDGEQIQQLEPCGHTFHKREILQWMESNSICPKCSEKVDFVDVQPD